MYAPHSRLASARAGVTLLLALTLAVACGGDGGGPDEGDDGYITVLPDTVRLKSGDLGGLTAVAYDNSDVPLPEQPTFTYTSNDPALFSVDASGQVTSLGPSGSGSVTISGGGNSKTIPVLVAGIPTDGILSSTTIAGAPYSVGINDAGKMILSLAGTATVVRGDLPAYTFPTTINTGVVQPLGVTINNGGSLAYVGLPDGIGIVNLTNNAINHPISEAQVGQIFSMVFSPSGATVYASGTRGKIYAISVATNQVTDSTDVIGIAEQMVYHPSAARIYAAMGDKTVELNATTLDVLRTFAGVGGKGLALSPTGNTVYTINEGQALRIINLANGVVTPVETVFGFGLVVRDNLVVISNALGVQFVDREVRVPVKFISVGSNNRRPTLTSTGMVVVPDENGAVHFIH